MKKSEGEKKAAQKPKGPSVFSVLGPYMRLVLGLAVFVMLGNGATLIVPKLISRGIDRYSAGTLVMPTLVWQFLAVSVLVLCFSYAQGVFQTYLSERAARGLREKLARKISELSYSKIEEAGSGKLLTNLTSDIDAIKQFIAMGVVNIIASVVLILGSAALLVATDWRLALAVLAVLPLISVLFFFVFKRVGPLFGKGQAILDRVNSVISESIVAAALVRVLSAEKVEAEKFSSQNLLAKENGMKILGYFSLLIPSVGLVANLAMLVILALGGRFVISGSMSLGDFAAFTSYVYILIFPIIMLGFVSNLVSRAQESYVRIAGVLNAPDEKESGEESAIKGAIEVKGAKLSFGEKDALKDVSFKVAAGEKVAIVGPTAAGKTQLLNLLIGLVRPTSGEILYDGKPLPDYSKKSLHSQVAIVFQDSVMFNMTLRENVSFREGADEESVKRAIEAAELSDFVSSLPKGLDTMASERGTSLSGGQKQRVMLARALSISPRVLLLDDFTARVDEATESRILSNLERLYPDMTVVSVTQKIRSAERFDKVILLMEGEKVAEGTHQELSQTSPEYAQILESQKSTQSYE